ncbi:MAG: DUF262 domain-containing protein [Chloroflexota bacterium]|nr:DUF262 domain-containing protein [Chloroflexota bacterium]
MTDHWRRNRQTISWFVDLHRRQLLDMDPPYQRRSVWNQRYREDFIETVLLGYPAPSIFLHEDIDSDGNQRYAVVDGKQRLTAVMDFAANEFPTRDDPAVKLSSDLQGKYFKGLEPDVRRAFFAYEFTIEYVPTTNEVLISEVFDRINRNVARLTRQELRHARYNGLFATAMEDLAEELEKVLPPAFPRIVEASRRQMKDVEFVAQLALLIERGPTSTGQDELDRTYASRDDEWEDQDVVSGRFLNVLKYVASLANVEGADLVATRLRNQVDFYALFGAVAAQLDPGLPTPDAAATRLRAFIDQVGLEDEDAEGDTKPEEANEVARRYYDAARSAANDPGQRATRIEILRQVISDD